MSTYGLGSVFKPASVAVIGASPRERSVGRIVLRNLRQAGFEGALGLVNPRHRSIDGMPSAARVADLGWTPELVVITAPARLVPRIAAEAAAAGTRAAIVVSAGLGEGPDSFAAQLQAVARPAGLRIVGPNCLGVMAPHLRLNASFAAHAAGPGDLALLSQSGAIAAAMLEWGRVRSVGFSAVAALGDGLDVDFGDLLDYFAFDRHTRAILLYVEAIRDARKFMSAARAAARAKPVVVVKAGRHARAVDPVTHTAALAAPDAVYGAAFRRAGLLRVQSLDDLFAAAGTLRHLRATPGRRLAILGNGGGVGALALDRLLDLEGTPARLSEATAERLKAALPATWGPGNPVDITGDADGARYAAAIDALLADPENDALLLINVPTALSSSAESARAVATSLARRPPEAVAKPVFGVWLGSEAGALQTLAAAGVPTYASEAEAVRGFMYLVRHREAQQALMETPPSLPEDFAVDAATAREVVSGAMAAGREWLDPPEVARLLEAYAIPFTPLQVAADPDEAVAAAAPLLAAGQAVAVKVLSHDIVHKSDVDGVRLDLVGERDVREAAQSILRRAREARPDARIEGVTVQPMIRRQKARELILGIADDPTFGPVIVFGRGGTAVEVIDDKALALPPLDLRLAHELIGRTRVSRILKAYRDVPAADERAVALVLVKLAQLAADIPALRELDINPLLADRDGVIAVDARVRIAPSQPLHKGPGHPRFAVRPYPSEWEREVTLADGARAFVRPVRPEDDAMFRRFFEHVSSEDLRLRFFNAVRHFSHEFIARLTQLDYARAIALAMIDPDSGEMLGAVRLVADADYDRGEYGILVRSDLKGKGIGWRLMRIMIEYAHWLELRMVEGQVLRENSTMIEMCRQLGFRIQADPEDATLVNVVLPVAND
ncbi:bifunctional acetate--CoA ligase family protein/GNAT family N-acetyltransferase [Luteimonas sp. RD2P54]|uniref:Bifunctional acetate--CoA ligase family protein/GNAT family N-acetyltransferase n=1 Tax=Luteimonas endophytica TaxID=3042023 RepID=A0ABT6JDF7_9GAMM|nr:bifunctional acetate--CoA ligase family protein/GNAT family N-acetyltransferase [Luteimonas endophytica]MDH5824865.1 bifunctional acetate--CoA ligase family protein/GNAT family N-acetyltransferase [Luteimonas endophytica]